MASVGFSNSSMIKENFVFLLSKARDHQLNVEISQLIFNLLSSNPSIVTSPQMVQICLTGCKSYGELLKLGIRNDRRDFEFFKMQFKILVWPYTRNRSLTEMVAVICITRSMWRIKAKNSNIGFDQRSILESMDSNSASLRIGSASANQVEQQPEIDYDPLYNQTSDDDLYNS